MDYKQSNILAQIYKIFFKFLIALQSHLFSLNSKRILLTPIFDILLFPHIPLIYHSEVRLFQDFITVNIVFFVFIGRVAWIS